jgi:hypothetical protein
MPNMDWHFNICRTGTKGALSEFIQGTVPSLSQTRKILDSQANHLVSIFEKQRRALVERNAGSKKRIIYSFII